MLVTLFLFADHAVDHSVVLSNALGPLCECMFERQLSNEMTSVLDYLAQLGLVHDVTRFWGK